MFGLAKKQKDSKSKEALLLKLSLYLVSLWTLLLMLIILKADFTGITGDMSWKQKIFTGLGNNVFSLCCLGFIVLGSIGYFLFKDISMDSKSLPVRVIRCKNINYENLSFLATYIIPLVCFPLEDIRQVIVLFLTLLVIGFIFVKTDLFYTNPSLVLLGFNIYNIQFKDSEEEYVLICRGKLHKDASIKYLVLSENVLFGRRL